MTCPAKYVKEREIPKKKKVIAVFVKNFWKNVHKIS